MAKTETGAGHRKTPWRDNIEALTVAIVMAVVLKYFVIEAYQIPTGSMQPTLMGSKETGIYDRILVDKLSYRYRDPERFEVAVFKYPLNRAQNFVKRIVGMPNEQLLVRSGDLWTRPNDSAPWKILHRPRPIQRETWKELDPDMKNAPVRWTAEKPGGTGWTLAPHSIGANSAGRARFTGAVGSQNGFIMDSYFHGYPPGMVPFMKPEERGAQFRVGDLRVEGEVRALAGCTAVTVEFDEGRRHYVLEIPGPAAAADATLRITWTGDDGNTHPTDVREVRGKAYRLPAGKSVAFGGQNLDDELTLDVDGEVVCRLDIPEAEDASAAAYVGTQGAGANFENLQVYRDIYYIALGQSQVTIPDHSYFMMGDNTQNSSDSRLWSLRIMQVPGVADGKPVRGNDRLAENPLYGTDEHGLRTWFRDEWGELYTFAGHPGEEQSVEPASFVDRRLIQGRALFVFWPMSPSLGVYRLKWVH